MGAPTLARNYRARTLLLAVDRVANVVARFFDAAGRLVCGVVDLPAGFLGRAFALAAGKSESGEHDRDGEDSHSRPFWRAAARRSWRWPAPAWFKRHTVGRRAPPQTHPACPPRRARRRDGAPLRRITRRSR